MFVIPGDLVKDREDRRVVLTRVARSVTDQVRGTHPAFAFTDKGKSVAKMNHSAWKRARVAVGLPNVRMAVAFLLG